MITKSDSLNCAEFKNYYIIFSNAINHESPNYFNINNKSFFKKYIKKKGGKVITKEFSYSSETNQSFMNISQIRLLIDQIEKNKYEN